MQDPVHKLLNLTLTCWPGLHSTAHKTVICFGTLLRFLEMGGIIQDAEDPVTIFNPNEETADGDIWFLVHCFTRCVLFWHVHVFVFYKERQASLSIRSRPYRA